MKTLMAFAAILILSISAKVNAGLLLALDNANDTLVSIDTDTLALNTVGPLGTDANFAGLAWDPLNGTLYMAGGRNNNNLYTVDMGTGAASLVGEHGIIDLLSIAYDTSTNSLYGAQFSRGSGLYEVNVMTGLATQINAAMSSEIGGMTYNPTTDLLVGIEDGNGDLYEIDRATGNLNLLYDGAFVNNSGLAYDVDKNLYWNIDYSGNLYTYDPSNGFERSTMLTGLGNFDGLAYIYGMVNNPEPEPVNAPSTLALIVLTLFGFRKLKRAQS